MGHRTRQAWSFSAAVVLAAAASLAVTAPARAYEDAAPTGEFLMGVGYSHVEFKGGDITLDDQDCIHFAPMMSFAPVESLPQLRLGGGVGFTIGLDDVNGIIHSGGNGLVVVAGADSALFLFQPEVVLSWRQPIGPEHVGFYIEPGVAAGGTFAWLDVNELSAQPKSVLITGDTWASTYSGRVFLRSGMRVTGGTAGLEASYLRGGRLDFGHGTGGDVSEFYIGIFGAIMF